MSVPDLVCARINSWQTYSGPASDAEISALVAECPFALPPDYFELLRVVNGGEGELSVSPWWFQLWAAQDASPHNKGYKVSEFHPGFWAFGSSGGGVMFAFGVDGKSAVFGLPFDSIDPRDIFVVANTFREFLLALGKPPVRAV